MPSNTPEHGTPARYKQRCRCDRCREWKARDQASYRARKAARDGQVKAPRARVPRATPSPTPAGAGPIETAARLALVGIGGEGPLADLRRQIAYRAAEVMDTRPQQFRSAGETLRAAVTDLLGSNPAGADAEGDALAELLGRLGTSRR